MNKIQITDDIIRSVENTFVTKSPSTVKTKPCRIKFNGKFITTSSNKTVWRNIGFAKSALLYHFYTNLVINDMLEKITGNTYVPKNVFKKLIEDLVASGVIEFVEVDMETFAVQKDY